MELDHERGEKGLVSSPSRDTQEVAGRWCNILATGGAGYVGKPRGRGTAEDKEAQHCGSG